MSCPQRGVSSPLLCVSDTRRQHGNVRHWDGGGRLEKPTMPLLQAHLWVLHLHNWRQGFALGSKPCCQHHNYKYLISYILYIPYNPWPLLGMDLFVSIYSYNPSPLLGYGFSCLHIFHLIPYLCFWHDIWICALWLIVLLYLNYWLLTFSRETFFTYYLITFSDLTWWDHLSKIWFAPWYWLPDYWKNLPMTLIWQLKQMHYITFVGHFSHNIWI